jgi:hypothetical protein
MKVKFFSQTIQKKKLNLVIFFFTQSTELNLHKIYERKSFFFGLFPFCYPNLNVVQISKEKNLNFRKHIRITMGKEKVCCYFLFLLQICLFRLFFYKINKKNKLFKNHQENNNPQLKSIEENLSSKTIK